MNDFRDVLAIAPGRELDAFPLRLRQVMTLEAFADCGVGQAFADFDAFHAQHRDAAGDDDFATLARVLAPPAPREGDTTLPPGAMRFGHVTMLPGSDGDDDLRLVTAYHGACDEALSWAQLAWLGHSEVRTLLRLLHLATRRAGSVAVPPEWSAGTLDVTIAGPLWTARIVEGLALYAGIEHPRVAALHLLAQWLFAAAGDTAERTALCLWDEVLVQHDSGNASGAIDGLALAARLPAGHPRFDRLAGELAASPNAAVRWQAAALLAQRPSAGGVPALADAALRETAWAAAVDQVRALRLAGGDAAFDALVAVAAEGRLPAARALAARALPWVEHCADARRRIGALLRSADRKRRDAGADALVEARRGTVFGRGGVLAGPGERRFLDALRAYVRSPFDAEPPGDLVQPLAERRVVVEVERDAAGGVTRVRCVSAGGTPLVDDSRRARALAALLARLGAIELPGCRVGEDALRTLLASHRYRESPSPSGRGDR